MFFLINSHLNMFPLLFLEEIAEAYREQLETSQVLF